jgi:hypothetical protein
MIAAAVFSGARAKLTVWLAAALLAIALVPRGHAATPDPADSLSDADKVCLGCHGAEGLKKELKNGDSLSLHVGAAGFAKSVHKPVGCQGCHTQVKLPEHPGDVKTPESAHAYKLAQTETCRSCHERVVKTYETSMHAAKLREGASVAPTCADCHRPHEVSPASVQDGPRNACLTCHAGSGRHAHQVAAECCASS